jgi:outer membrane protein assembly factor BamE
MDMNWTIRSRLLAALCASLMLTACLYSIDIQQGNFLESKDIDRVAVGMSRVQVRSLLGTPMVSDPFEGARWDYVYYFKASRSRDVLQRHFIVYFEGDKVSKIDRSDQAKGRDEAPASTAASTS